MGFKSESRGNNYKKVENMWNDCSDNTLAFPNPNNMDKNDIECASGTQLVKKSQYFSSWMLSELKTVLDGQNKLCCSPELMPKAIGKLCVMLERKKYFLPVGY